MELILIRHGETRWNEEGRVQGFSDTKLSDVGLRQVQQLAQSLKNHQIQCIYSSPLVRALKTAQIINQYHNAPIHLESGLMEMDLGDCEGLRFRELMECEEDFWRGWRTDPASVRMPSGESLIELQTRAWKVVERVFAKPENALVASHNFTIAAILCKIKNISLSEFGSVCVDPASKTIIRFRDGSAFVEVFNDRSHLHSHS